MQRGAVVSQFPDPVESEVDDVLPDRVPAPCEVVGCVFFARNELAGMVEMPIFTSPNLIHHSWLQVHHNRPGHILPSPCFRKEGVEGVVCRLCGLSATGGDAMLEAEQFPAGVSQLDASLSDV